MFRKIVIIIVFLLISTGTLDASIFFEIKPKLDLNRPANKQERLNFAKALHKRIFQVYDAIPHLSPSQEKWLKNEISAKNQLRALKAFQSDEMYLQDIKERLEYILNSLRMIINGKYKEQRHEILAWLDVAYGMMHVGLFSGIAELVNRNLVNFSDERFGNSDLMLVTFNSIGRSILIAVIGPYIAGQLPE